MDRERGQVDTGWARLGEVEMQNAARVKTYTSVNGASAKPDHTRYDLSDQNVIGGNREQPQPQGQHQNDRIREYQNSEVYSGYQKYEENKPAMRQGPPGQTETQQCPSREQQQCPRSQAEEQRLADSQKTEQQHPRSQSSDWQSLGSEGDRQQRPRGQMSDWQHLISHSAAMSSDVSRHAPLSLSPADWQMKRNNAGHMAVSRSDVATTSVMTTSSSISHPEQVSRCYSVVDLMRRPPFPVPGSMNSMQSLNSNPQGMYSIPKLMDNMLRTSTQGNSPSVSLPQLDYHHQHPPLYLEQQHPSLSVSQQLQQQYPSVSIPQQHQHPSVSLSQDQQHQHPSVSMSQQQQYQHPSVLLSQQQQFVSVAQQQQQELSVLMSQQQQHQHPSVSDSQQYHFNKHQHHSVIMSKENDFMQSYSLMQKDLVSDLKSEPERSRNSEFLHLEQLNNARKELDFSENLSFLQNGLPSSELSQKGDSGVFGQTSVMSTLPSFYSQTRDVMAKGRNEGICQMFSHQSHTPVQHQEYENFRKDQQSENHSQKQPDQLLYNHSNKELVQNHMMPGFFPSFGSATVQSGVSSGIEKTNTRTLLSQTVPSTLSSTSPASNMFARKLPNDFNSLGSSGKMSPQERQGNQFNRDPIKLMNHSYPNVSESANIRQYDSNQQHRKEEQISKQQFPQSVMNANERQTSGSQKPPKEESNKNVNNNQQNTLNSFNPSSQCGKQEVNSRHPFQTSASYSDSGRSFLSSPGLQKGGENMNTKQSVQSSVYSSGVSSVKLQDKGNSQTAPTFKNSVMNSPVSEDYHHQNQVYPGQENTFKVPPNPPPQQQKQYLPEKQPLKIPHKEEKSNTLSNFPSSQGRAAIAKPKAVRNNPKKKKLVGAQSFHHQTNLSSLFPQSSLVLPPFSQKNDLARSKVKPVPSSERKISDLMESEVDRKLLAMFPQYRFYLDQNVKPMEEIMPLPGESDIMKKIQKAKCAVVDNEIKKKRKLKKKDSDLPDIKTEVYQAPVSVQSSLGTNIKNEFKPENSYMSQTTGGDKNTEQCKSEKSDQNSEVSSQSSDINTQPKSDSSVSSSNDSSIQGNKEAPSTKFSGMCCAECEDAGVMFSQQCRNRINSGFTQTRVSTSQNISSSCSSSPDCVNNLNHSFSVSSSSENIFSDSNKYKTSNENNHGDTNDSKQSSDHLMPENATPDDSKINYQENSRTDKRTDNGKGNNFKSSANCMAENSVKIECSDSVEMTGNMKCENEEHVGSSCEDMPLNNLQATIQKLFDRVYSGQNGEDMINKFEQSHGNVEISPQKLTNPTEKYATTPPFKNEIKTSPTSAPQTPTTSPEKSKVHFDIDGVWANGRQVPYGLSESLDDHLRNNRIEIPYCNCLGPGVSGDESDGPYYTQLGSARSVPAIRAILEARTGVTGKAIRIEKVHYTGKEGKTSLGCPMAKWIIRRSSYEEKYLCVIKQRKGHFCENTMIIIALVAWEGVPCDEADGLYSYISKVVTKEGHETERRCGTNERRTCACQGIDLVRRGASFSFGCSWSMYFNGCKFARSRNVRKFKLKDTSQEETLENKLQGLASQVGPLFKKMAPDAHRNQCKFSEEGQECRLGKNPPKEKPFSGVTACVDFCAHAHKDLHNINNGSTVVVTLSKNRGLKKPEDEQLHVLPLYVLDPTDENGSREGQLEKIRSGALEVLTNFPCEARIRSKPLTPCKKRAKLNKILLSKGLTCLKEKSIVQAKAVPNVPEVKKSNTPAGAASKRKLPEGGRKGSFEQLISLSGLPNYQDLYDKFWDYFYSNGSFPPETFLSKWAEARGGQVSSTSANNQNSPGENHTNSQLSNHPQMDCDMQRPQTNVFNSSQTDRNLHNQYSNGGDPPTKKLCLTANENDLRNSCENNWQPSCKSQEARPLSAVPFNSPLDMLCEAAMRTDPPRPQSHPPSLTNVPYPSHSASPMQGDRSHQLSETANTFIPTNQHSMQQQNTSSLPINNSNSHSNIMCSDNSFCDPQQFACNVNQQSAIFQNGQQSPKSAQNCSELEEGIIDPTVVRCEMDYNESNFRDPEIGGVAIALGHGAVLFEVAKRELHATTALRNPNRYHPTRISLVFYQHKNLNFANHGWAEHEKKMELLHEKRLRAALDKGLDVEDMKPGKRKKKKKEVLEVDFAKTSAAQYKYMWDAPVRHGLSFTTDSIITRWIDPQPMVSGPYQHWV